MSNREVLSLHRAVRDDIQDLVTRRPLPAPDLPQVDPFLFLNHHGPQIYPPNNTGLPFGPHPHRGFETVTFILDGSLAHHDSGSGASVVEAGGVSGVVARALDGWVGDQLSGVVGPAVGECGDACVAAVEVLAAVEGGAAVMVERLGVEQSRVFGSEVSVWSAGRRLGVRDAGVTPQ